MTCPPASAIRSILGDTELPQSKIRPSATPLRTASQVMYSGSQTPVIRSAYPSASIMEACTEEYTMMRSIGVRISVPSGSSVGRAALFGTAT